MSDALVWKHEHLRVKGALEMHPSSQTCREKDAAAREPALRWARLPNAPFCLNSFTEFYVHTLLCVLYRVCTACQKSSTNFLLKNVPYYCKGLIFLRNSYTPSELFCKISCLSFLITCLVNTSTEIHYVSEVVRCLSLASASVISSRWGQKGKLLSLPGNMRTSAVHVFF